MEMDTLNLSPIKNKKWSYWWEAFVLLIILSLTTGLNAFVEDIIQPSSLVFTYLVSTVAGGVFFGTWAAVFSFIGGFLIFNFFFVEPYFTLYIADPQDVYNIVIYFAIAGLVTYLIRIVRKQNEFLADRLDRTALIEDMSSDFLALTPLAQSFSEASIPSPLRKDVLNQLGQIVIRYTTRILNTPALVCFPQDSGILKSWVKSSPDLAMSADDQASADWTFHNGELSGAGALTHAKSQFYFLPLKSHEYVIGVLGIRADFRDLFPEQRRILGAISNLTSLVVTRWVDLKFAS